MATIVTMSSEGPRDRDVTPTTLGASDTLVYAAGAELFIYNGTAGTITPNIDGDGAPTALEVPGGGTKDLSAGYTWPVAIAIGDVSMIPLDTIREYLAGTIALTAADGAKAWIRLAK